jgi:DNA-directed RNA polymerase subunit RPC12/RpoP
MNYLSRIINMIWKTKYNDFRINSQWLQANLIKIIPIDMIIQCKDCFSKRIIKSLNKNIYFIKNWTNIFKYYKNVKSTSTKNNS